ncbi:MAG: DUF2442 domain-containing protein [Gemmatimonadaceae bacterium]
MSIYRNSASRDRLFRSSDLGDLRRLVEQHREFFEDKGREHFRNHRQQGPPEPLAVEAWCTDDALHVRLADGREVSVPLEWYSRLAHGTPAEHGRWRLIGRGEGIHWPDLDEDISVEGLLAGRRSGESQRSLKRWLEARQCG